MRVESGVRSRFGRCRKRRVGKSPAASIASRAKGRYACEVHRPSLHRWSIVVLLVMRLIMGEFAHAMPHQDASAGTDAPAVADGQELPCPDHADPDQTRKSHTDQLSSESGVKTHTGDSHDTNCCEAACACPCLHLSALALLAAPVSVAVLDQPRFPAAVLGHLPDRISLLLRPPA